MDVVTIFRYLFWIFILSSHSILAKNVTFWQITDIHYDKFYVKNGDVQKFCHSAAGIGKARRFGEYDCETNKDLFLSALEAMVDIEPDPDFILWTGDSSPHWKDPNSPDWEYVYEAEEFIKDTIKKFFPQPQKSDCIVA